MATIEAIRIINLRSLKDTGWIDQKPITILVGKNSAGKSTFARFFPLMKQSVSARKQSPILWFGQYVDFGQYSVAVNNNALSKSISFGFRLTTSSLEIERRNPAVYAYRIPKTGGKDFNFSLEVEISLVKGGEFHAADTVVDELKITLFGMSVKVQFENGSVTSIKVDDMEIWKERAGYFCHVTFDSAIPKFSFYKERVAVKNDSAQEEAEIFLDEFDPFSPHLIQEIRKHVHGNLGGDKVRQIASRLILTDGENFREQALAAGQDQRMWIDHIGLMKEQSQSFKNLQRALICARLPEILRVVDSSILAQFSAVQYIEPLRATAQRYYRKQDLAIGELDAKGANVAQFLHGLPYWRREEFDDFSRRLFGFTVKPRAEGGHIELVVEHAKGGPVVNLADAGVGFSQMLPILLQFWALDNVGSDHKPRVSTSAITSLVVEQPELHLHPAYQATLANLFCETVGSSFSNRARIIAETHSPALVNRLGSLVADGRIKANDIQILIFEQSTVSGETEITKSVLTEEGVLVNWPYGFFEPEA